MLLYGSSSLKDRSLTQFSIFLYTHNQIILQGNSKPSLLPPFKIVSPSTQSRTLLPWLTATFLSASWILVSNNAETERRCLRIDCLSIDSLIPRPCLPRRSGRASLSMAAPAISQGRTSIHTPGKNTLPVY